MLPDDNRVTDVKAREEMISNYGTDWENAKFVKRKIYWGKGY